MRSMKAGERINIEDIGVLRTEKVLSVGLHPRFLDDVIGSKLSRDIHNGEGVKWEQITIKNQKI